jgi:hypothetical protein
MKSLSLQTQKCERNERLTSLRTAAAFSDAKRRTCGTDSNSRTPRLRSSRFGARGISTWLAAPPSGYRRVLPVVLVCLVLALLSLAPDARADFGISNFEVQAIEANGTPDNRAGSHPYALATEIDFNLAAESPEQPGGPFTDGDLKDLHLELPPGLIEDPAAIPQCTLAQFHTPRSSPFEASLSGESCPDKTQVGVIAVHTSYGGGSTRTFGVFDLVPPPGAPSQLGFSPFGVPITLTPHIRQAEGEYGLTLDSTDFSQLLDLYGFKLTLWGAPWLIAHDDERGNCLDEAAPGAPHGQPATPEGPGSPPMPPYHAGTCSTGNPKIEVPKAYLTLPTSCAAPMETRIEVDSWQQPAFIGDSSLSHDAEGHPRALEACGALGLATTASLQPTSERASSASGVDFNLEPEDEGLLNPNLLATSQIKEAVVALPAGITINPSVGAGLGVCTLAQYSAETVSSAPGAGCPNAAKIGDFTVESPLLESQLVKGQVKGSLFLAQPDDPATAIPGAENPFDSLLAVYLVARSAERGVFVKLAGKLAVDPATGQLTATFDGLPQLPYSHLQVHFREGQRSPLATPAACGTYSTPIDLTPWFDPGTTFHQVSSFQLTQGVGGSSCPSGATPFAPGAQAGTLNSNAGSYSPFYLHLTRTDNEQEITSYSAKLPPGLLGKIAGIPYCPEADIEAAKRETGVGEEQRPSCPAASEIGHTIAGYGVGAALTYAPGGLYLAGPFHGSAFSVVAIDSATVGPFDLGTIVVRSAIEVNHQTAQVSIDSAGSDPIPHIVKGIPIHLRDIRVYISRPNFTVNPTSCDPFQVASTLNGSAPPFTNPVDAIANAPAPFQVSDCSALGFAPKLALKLKGGARRGDYPALTATVTPHPGDANIGAATVTLPPTEFLAQNHIKTICTRPQFERGACPAGSVYGHARAITPLLSEPMEGPVYLRSSTNPLPDLVADLHGQGIEIEVAGRIDSHHGGIRATFTGLPDAPVTKFTMALNGGKRGLLVNERNVCTSTEKAIANFVGQDNKGELLHPPLRADRCPKAPKHRGGSPGSKGGNSKGGESKGAHPHVAAPKGKGEAAIAQSGQLFVTFNGGITPRALPRHALAPIGVDVSGTVSTLSGARPPALRKIVIELNRGGHLDTRGLPVCNRELIRASSDAQALAACGAALVGEGSFAADIAFPEQSAFPSRGHILAFNSSSDGRPIVLVHVYGADPVPITRIIAFHIRNSDSQYGTILTGALPESLNPYGYVKRLDLSLYRTFSYRGAIHSYLSAACAAPPGFPGAVFPFARTSMTFADGRTLTSTLTRSCKVAE